MGYSRVREGRTEPPLEHEPLYGMLGQLQNEGTATYVAYQACEQIPAPDELDFRALDSPDEVTRALEEVNDLLGKVGTVSDERMGKLSWNVGVDGRAYYVAGAHMAATIDRVSGRDAGSGFRPPIILITVVLLGLMFLAVMVRRLTA